MNTNTSHVDKTDNSKHGLVAVVLPWLIIACFTVLTILLQTPPDVVPAEASPDVFSAARAMQHVTALAKQPRPIGSGAHAAAREYIMNQLTAAGLAPQTQQTSSIREAAHLENIIATLKGTTPGRSILLMAHYDSVPGSFGASDDAAGVATLLETVRALRAGPPLKNDVVFLFTDGEESGLLGAKAFVYEHPDAKNVGLVLNFEARGTRGPSFMFETTQGNGWIIREFAEVAPYPFANSLSDEVYRSLPNDTDFTVFKDAGVPGLNFAYIDDISGYHTQLDTPDRLDQRSLQHHGSYAVALTRHFGNLDLSRGKEPDQIYFDLVGRVLLHYSERWALPFALIISCLFISLTVIGLKNGSLRLEGIAMGAIAWLSSFLVSALAATVLWTLVSLLSWRGTGGAAQGRLYLASFVLLTIAVTSVIYIVIGRKSKIESLTMGALLWWTVFALVTSWLLPGGSYLFVWPLCFGLLGVGILMFSRYRAQQELSVPLSIVLGLCALPGILFVVPIIYQLFVALTLNSTFIIITMVSILLGLFIPHLEFLTRRLRWLVPVVAGASAIVLFAVAIF